MISAIRHAGSESAKWVVKYWHIGYRKKSSITHPCFSDYSFIFPIAPLSPFLSACSLLSLALDGLSDYQPWCYNSVYARSVFQSQAKPPENMSPCQQHNWGLCSHINTHTKTHTSLFCPTDRYDLWVLLLLLLHHWQLCQSHLAEFACWFLPRATASLVAGNVHFYRLTVDGCWGKWGCMVEVKSGSWSANLGSFLFEYISGSVPGKNFSVRISQTQTLQSHQPTWYRGFGMQPHMPCWQTQIRRSCCIQTLKRLRITWLWALSLLFCPNRNEMMEVHLRIRMAFKVLWCSFKKDNGKWKDCWLNNWQRCCLAVTYPFI